MGLRDSSAKVLILFYNNMGLGDSSVKVLILFYNNMGLGDSYVEMILEPVNHAIHGLKCLFHNYQKGQ
jgi:hypothetical protein